MTTVQKWDIGVGSVGSPVAAAKADPPVEICSTLSRNPFAELYPPMT